MKKTYITIWYWNTKTTMTTKELLDIEFSNFLVENAINEYEIIKIEQK